MVKVQGGGIVMTWVGVITGNIASGKSVVTRALIQKGVEVVVSDTIVHGFLSHPDCITEIERHLADKTRHVRESASLTSRVRKAMFDDADFKRWYLPWMTDRVLDVLQSRIDRHRLRGSGMLFLDVPLFFETRCCLTGIDEVWLVWAPKCLRISRWKRRSRASFAQMSGVEDWQIGDREKVQKVDIVLSNVLGKPNLESQVEWAMVRVLGS